jgi:hypothetical protein
MNNNLNIIQDLIKTCSDRIIDNICDIITNKNNNYIEELKNITNLKNVNNISYLIKFPYYKKSVELKTWIVNKLLDIIFNYVEDWKDQKKINLIKLLIIFGYFDVITLKQSIGKQSKKTYRSREIIDESSLALKMFFDNNELKNKTDDFYSKLDIIREDIVKLGVEFEIIKNITKQMIEVINCDIVCRQKYDNDELEKYSLKISDIVDTRLKEKIFFELFNKIKFKTLVNDTGNEALECILYVSWDETKQRYYWLTQLISFINNNNIECKEYLINECGVSPFESTDNKTKEHIIRTVVKNIGLNMENIDQIINFIFSISVYFKHGTYYKWYNKEYENIKLFEKYKNKSFNENILDLVVKINNNIELEPIHNLLLLMNDYNSRITFLSKKIS